MELYFPQPNIPNVPKPKKAPSRQAPKQTTEESAAAVRASDEPRYRPLTGWTSPPAGVRNLLPVSSAHLKHIKKITPQVESSHLPAPDNSIYLTHDTDPKYTILFQKKDIFIFHFRKSKPLARLTLQEDK